MGKVPRLTIGASMSAGVLVAAVVWLAAAPTPIVRMAQIPAGVYVPLYAPPPAKRDAAPRRLQQPKLVRAFEMDVYPVTNAEYLEFVRQHPEWRRSRVAPLFADGGYLRHWRGDLDPGDRAPMSSPVVNMSWFAARAYLRAQGKDLPTVDQWERVAAASETRRDASRDAAFLAKLRFWYSQPAPEQLPAVGSADQNVYGIHDLHGLVWEWVLDFNSALVTGESRADASLDRTRFCGSGAAGASDFENYPAFMRYGFRSSLEARYSMASLGFRGVRSPAATTP